MDEGRVRVRLNPRRARCSHARALQARKVGQCPRPTRDHIA
nr:MAG TPA: hypothetical protein [Caudoviricetes sp.]